MSNKSVRELIKEHKTVFIIIAVILFLIELEIFAIAAMKSGRKEYLQILDANGQLVYETDGSNLSDFNKYYFEKTFGDLDHYEKIMRSEDVAFPFRAWFTAAVGIPIGVILLFAFVVRGVHRHLLRRFTGKYVAKQRRQTGDGLQPGKGARHGERPEHIHHRVSDSPDGAYVLDHPQRGHVSRQNRRGYTDPL
jgi:uncharacterized integral membrane protein